MLFLKSILSTLFKYPQLLMLLLLVASLGFGYWYIDNQNAKIDKLNDTIVNLQDANKTLVQANTDLASDMKTIKQGMETYQANIAKIKAVTEQLQQNVNDPKFKALLKTDVKQAEKVFNSNFNDYMNSINQDTKKNAQ